MTHTYQIPTFYLFLINIIAPIITGIVIYREIQLFQEFSFPAFSFWSALPILTAWGSSILLFGIRNLYTRTQDKFVFVDNSFNDNTKEEGIDTLQEFGFQARFIVYLVILGTIGSMGYTLYHAVSLTPQDFITDLDSYQEATLTFASDSDVGLEDLYRINNLTPILFDSTILSQEIVLEDDNGTQYPVRVGQNQEAFENRVRTAITLDNQLESIQVVSLTSLISVTDPRLAQLQYYINQVEPSSQTFQKAWDEHAAVNGPTLLQYRGLIETLTVQSVDQVTEEDLLEDE